MTDTRIPADNEILEPRPAEARTRDALKHDLRNAVYAIMLQAECVETSAAAGETDAAIQGVAKIKSAARNTAELLEELLEGMPEE